MEYPTSEVVFLVVGCIIMIGLYLVLCHFECQWCERGAWCNNAREIHPDSNSGEMPGVRYVHHGSSETDEDEHSGIYWL